ncbi:2-phosphosulfolactate phosphatase [Nocardia sp. NPDC051832]|uniref:2-phosphosulfolactate phosphatase n=1 Tax=Nocardia sp. NPDC051832 TaxID=3155673 RepID=UPI00341C7419
MTTSEFPEWAQQARAGVRFDWGSAGARALGPHSAALVVVDVLSFTTTVSVAVDAGTAVLPYPWRDGNAAEFAAAHDAELAVGRRAMSEQHPWSLSAAALRRAPVPRRLVLPSPNGSAISAAVTGIPVIAACLRNASAVGAWIAGQGWGTEQQPVAVIAAGEHWPGRHGLRPAVEDWLGAAAVLSALAGHGSGPLSPEALAAQAGYDGIGDVRAIIRDCASGRELAAGGFGDDVAVAIELETSTVVPVLVDGAFIDGSKQRDGRKDAVHA